MASCIIRKNSTEIRENLDKMGFLCNPFDMDIENEDKWIIVHVGLYMTINPYESMGETTVNVVDCGINEMLFFAVANYNEISDYKQLFMFSDKTVSTCMKNTNYAMWGEQGMCGFTRKKMSIDDIIKYFS